VLLFHPMKCNVCNKSETETKFYKSDKYRCAQCNRERAKARYDKDPDKARKIALKSHYKNRDRKLAYMKAYGKELKNKVFLHYGGYICSCCGEKEKIFLTLDHIDGGGNKHRNELSTGGYGIYRWAVKNNYPPIFKILCFNCNSGRALNNGVCPHEEKNKP